MHRISAIFNKLPRDGKYKENIEACDDSSDSNRSFQSIPRLVRSPVIRGLRYSDNGDLSGILLNGSDHSSESRNSSSNSSSTQTTNLASTHPTAFKTGSPLPSPPRSPVQLPTPAPILWPLPSPRQPPKRSEDSEQNLNGSSSQDSENGHGLPAHLLEGQMHNSLQSKIPTENHQQYSSHVGISGSPRVAGRRPDYHDEGVSSVLTKGGGAHVQMQVHTRQEPSNLNGHVSNILQSAPESGNHNDTRLWKNDQVIHADHPAADALSTEDYSSFAKFSYQNGHAPRDVGHSKHYSHAASPPLSSSLIRTLSPGGWQKGHLLGSGAFGKVYKGIHSETGEFCAIKEVECAANDHRSKESVKQLEKEIASLSTLQHPNIVQYKGSEMVGDSLYIYLELISGGSLQKLYREFKKLEEPVIRRYTKQILLGLHYLHSRKFVHRDIKCANILVDQDGTIKLADFGVAKYIKVQGVPFSLKGSPQWMAPEVIMAANTGFEYAVDVWSLGCTVIEMVTGKPPWCDLEAAAAMFKVIKVGAPPIPESLSPEGQSFLRLCLQRNPADRPSVAALLKHPFVQIHNDPCQTMSHAFDSLNAMNLGESRVQDSLHPYLSAPSSPQSPHRLAHQFYFSQPDLLAFSRDRAKGHPSANMDRNNILPRKGLKKPKKIVPTTEIRHSHEFVRHRRSPSLSAPVSPQSSHGVPGSLYPTRSTEIPPRYPTTFSEGKANPRHSSELAGAYGRTG